MSNRVRRLAHDSFVWLFGSILLGAWLPIPAAMADEAVYSLALKGSPNTPIGLRAFWSQTTGVDAKLRYEFDLKHQQALAKLKIPRVKEWPTKLDNDKYFIRNADFTKIVADAVGSPTATYTLNSAEIIAVPGPWQLEVQIKFDGTERSPNKPPRAVSTKLEFTGTIEESNPDQLNQLVTSAYGRYIPANLKNVALRDRLKVVSNDQWKAFLTTLGETGDHPEVLGLTHVGTRLIYVRPGVPPTGILHELVHLYASSYIHDNTKMIRAMREGITNYLAQEAGKPKLDLSWAYPIETKIAEALVKAVGLDIVARAYFGNDKDFAELGTALDKKRGGKDLFVTVQAFMLQKDYSGAYGLLVGQ